jgi:hypothetical protein
MLRREFIAGLAGAAPWVTVDDLCGQILEHGGLPSCSRASSTVSWLPQVEKDEVVVAHPSRRRAR